MLILSSSSVFKAFCGFNNKSSNYLYSIFRFTIVLNICERFSTYFMASFKLLFILYLYMYAYFLDFIWNCTLDDLEKLWRVVELLIMWGVMMCENWYLKLVWNFISKLRKIWGRKHCSILLCGCFISAIYFIFYIKHKSAKTFYFFLKKGQMAIPYLKGRMALPYKMRNGLVIIKAKKAFIAY